MSFGCNQEDAFRIVKAAIRKDPKKVELLLDGAAKEVAYYTLKRISSDLNALLAVNQAFAAASAVLVEKFKELSCQEPTQSNTTPTTSTTKTT